MWRATSVVGGWTLASRVLGFARDILIAATLGAGPVADAFLVALKLPNLFRRLFGEGAFNAAFVPALTRAAGTEPAAIRGFVGEVAAVLAVALGLLVVIGELFMPGVMRGIAPGFIATPARFRLAVALTRITFPYLLLICLVALLSGVLNAMHRFAAAAAAPVLFNLTLIGALFGVRGALPTMGHALAVGVDVAGVLQLGFLGVACARLGLLPKLAWPRLTPGVRLVLRRMVPGLVGAGVTQLNLAIGVVIASLLPTGTIAVLYYADRVVQLPLGTIGVALGTTLLPSLSRDLARGDAAAAAARLNRAIDVALALVLPATFGLLLLAGPIMAVLFGRGAFGPRDVAASAAVLAAYATGLPGYVLAKLLAPAWFARGDTTTPVVIGGAAVAVNLGLGFGLIGPLGQLAPAVATSVAGLVNAALLGGLLWRRGDWRPDAALRRRAPRLLLASLIMAAGLGGAREVAAALLAAPGVTRWLVLGALIAGGVIIFGAAAQALGAIDLRDVARGRPQPVDRRL